LAHPRCVGGGHPGPDEDDGGAWGYQQLQDHYKFPPLEAASLPSVTTLKGWPHDRLAPGNLRSPTPDRLHW